MSVRKRGFQKGKRNFFRSKLVLDSWKSKVTFFVIVLMFGVVIVLGVMEVADVFKDLEENEENIEIMQLSPNQEKSLTDNEMLYSNMRMVERENDIHYKKSFSTLNAQNPLSEDEKNLMPFGQLH